MMSKSSDAKLACGYRESPILPVCMNCAGFTSEKRLPAWMEKRNRDGDGVFFSGGELYTIEKNGVEKNLRCKLHGFAVKKMASCLDYSEAKAK